MAEERIDGGVDRRLLRLVSEPTRLKALSVLTERSLSAREIAEQLAIGVEEAAGHIEAMLSEGLVEVAGEDSREEAAEPRYKASVELIWPDEAYRLLGAAGRRLLSTWLIETIEADVKAALESGLFDRLPDNHTSRTISLVDEQGWTETIQILTDALNAILDVREASAERLAERGEVGMPVLAAMICCEMPPRPGMD